MSFYRVTFKNPESGEISSLKAKTVKDSSLGLSFIALSDFLFHTRGMVVAPKEEQMQKQFENIKSYHLSIYSIIAIEEVGDTPDLQFEGDRSNLVVMPNPAGQ